MRGRLTMAFLMVVGLIPATSRANLIIELGNGPPNDTLDFSAPTGTISNTFILTEPDTGKTPVLMVTTDTPGMDDNGQAKDTATGTLFSTVTFTPTPGILGWKGFETDPDFSTLSTFTVTGVDQFNTPFTQTFTADPNGQDRFFILPDTIQYITKVTIATATPIIQDFDQVRIGDVVTEVNPVPEPSTLIGSLVGITSFTGFWWFRKRRQSAPV